jgi:pyruvate/2-oxoglutarate dehydrogenase complex dihydrolipoamide dehydrogenase (E3) component
VKVLSTGLTCRSACSSLARVGYSESEASRDGIGYRLLTLPMAGVLRTRTLSEPRGFLKMLIAADSDEILGFTAFGVESSELMAAVQVAITGRVPYITLRTAIFTHPTAAEGLTVLLSGTPVSP